LAPADRAQEYALLVLGLQRFVDPATVPQIPRTLRATLLPHRTVESLERTVERCSKRARNEDELKVARWVEDPAADFSPADDARLTTALVEFDQDFAKVARFHFPHRSPMCLKLRARKLGLCGA
jgi:hypothetical protein